MRTKSRQMREDFSEDSRIPCSMFTDQENKDGKWVNTDNYKAADAFAADDWDFVTVQQVSGYSGVSSSYGNLDALMKLQK